jgi:phosphoglycerate kinase
MAIKYIDQADFKDKKVIARFDFNVPLSGSPLSIDDTTRIDLAIPTIRHILRGGAKKLIIMSHLGRPKGVKDSHLSLEPVASYLADQIHEEILLTESATDSAISTILGLSTGRVIMLENLRFHPEEKANDQGFARTMASYADIYVNDAFGTCHRKHASTYGINYFFPDNAYGGLLLQREVTALSKVVERPKEPLVAILGGAKVKDKIKIIEKLLPIVNQMLIGGAMAYPFLKAQGYTVGKSLCDDADVKLAKQILMIPTARKILLPIDHQVSESMEGSATEVNQKDIPDEMIGLDIGPATIELYNKAIRQASTILWNGPMGLFEKSDFARGSMGVAKALAEATKAFTLVGGGDSVSAIKKSGLGEKISHISTGGGASLEFLENGTLPGIQVLKFGLDEEQR